MIVKIGLLAIIIFFSFRLINFVHRSFQYFKHIKYHISYIIPIVEIILWLVFSIGVGTYFYEVKKIKILILFAVIIFLASIPLFFIFRDFALGVYLKIQQKFDVGDFIEFDSIEGEIVEIGHFSIDIRSQYGDINTIPFNKLRSKIIAKHGQNPNLKKQILVFRFPGHYKTNYLIPLLKKSLWSEPWVAVSQAPVIEETKFEEGEHVFEVAVYTLKNEYADNIKDRVEESMRNFL